MKFNRVKLFCCIWGYSSVMFGSALPRMSADSQFSGERLRGDYLLRTSSDDDTKKYVNCEKNLSDLASGCPVSFVYLDETPQDVDNRDVYVNIKTVDGYLCALQDGEIVVVPNPGQYERFKIVKRGGDFYSLQTHHNTYLMANFGTGRLQQSGSLGDWEKFKVEKLEENRAIEMQSMNDFLGVDLFTEVDNVQIQYNAGDRHFPRASSAANLTNSWIYMPLIRSALVANEVVNPRHLVGVEQERESLSRALPVVFDTFAKILENTIKDSGVITFVDDVLLINGREYRFDGIGHMAPEDQDAFANEFLKASDVSADRIAGNSLFTKIKQLDPDLQDFLLLAIFGQVAEVVVTRPLSTPL